MSLDFYLNTEDVDGNLVTAFDVNITHNLGKMAREAGVYYALWRPEEKGYVRAKEIVEILEKGLEDLKRRPRHFKKFDAPNGWGTYEHFVPFVEECLAACKKHPSAIIGVSR